MSTAAVSLVRTRSGRCFPAAEGETLLDAALRADVTLAYSCRTGRCGTCKGRLCTGITAALHEELGLTASERDAGWVLTCVRTALSEIELEIEDLGNIRLAAPRTLPCRIQALDRLAGDVIKVALRLPPGSAFDYRPGQYVDVIGHGGLRRSYSVANAPAADRQLELHIRRVDGGAMSDYWFGAAKLNDLLRLHGPLGTFFLRDVAGADLVFLATGTGIAPVKAMLEGLDAQPAAPSSVTVYWGGRVPADLYWDTREAGTAHRFVPVLSRAGATWDGACGHVQDLLLADGRNWARTIVYACGSDAMIHGARRQLVAAGLGEGRFFADAFVCSAAA